MTQDKPVIICGAPFALRTFHAPDARYGEGRTARPDGNSLDRIITITLAAIPGYAQEMKPTRTVVL